MRANWTDESRRRHSHNQKPGDPNKPLSSPSLPPLSRTHTQTPTHLTSVNHHLHFKVTRCSGGAQNYAFCALWNGDLLKDQKNSVYLSQRGDRKWSRLFPVYLPRLSNERRLPQRRRARASSCGSHSRKRFGCTAKVERIIWAEQQNRQHSVKIWRCHGATFSHILSMRVQRLKAGFYEFIHPGTSFQTFFFFL